MSSDFCAFLRLSAYVIVLDFYERQWYNGAMTNENGKKRIEVAGALFVEKGKVLAFEKGDTEYPYTSHKFEFPGGKVENGETPRQALRRELLEELDLTAEVYDIFDTFTYEYPDFIVTLHVCLCRRLSDYKLKEHVRVERISSADLDPAEWAPADAHAVAKIKTHLL